MSRDVKQVDLTDWMLDGAARFGPDRDGWLFVCPKCQCKQSVYDFIEAGIKIGKAREYIGIHCIGIFNGKLTTCDFTLDALFDLHTIEVTGLPDDRPPQGVFEFADVVQVVADPPSFRSAFSVRLLTNVDKNLKRA